MCAGAGHRHVMSRNEYCIHTLSYFYGLHTLQGLYPFDSASAFDEKYILFSGLMFLA